MPVEADQRTEREPTPGSTFLVTRLLAIILLFAISIHNVVPAKASEPICGSAFSAATTDVAILVAARPVYKITAPVQKPEPPPEAG